MKLSQKRAIWYSERDRREQEQEAYLKSIGRWEEFCNSKYKYMGNFIKFVIGKEN